MQHPLQPLVAGDRYGQEQGETGPGAVDLKFLSVVRRARVGTHLRPWVNISTEPAGAASNFAEAVRKRWRTRNVWCTMAPRARPREIPIMAELSRDEAVE